MSNPEGTIMAIKRKMGTDYKVKENGKEYTPQQISAFILQKIRADAEAFLGEKVDKAVITVPAYLTITSVKRQRTRVYRRFGSGEDHQRANRCIACI